MPTCAQVADSGEPRCVAFVGGPFRARSLCNRLRYLTLVCIFHALIAAQATPIYADEDAIQSQKRGLADVERRVRDLEQDLDTRRDRREHLTAELEQRERNIADLARSGHQLTAMIDEQERALEKLRNRVAVEREALGRERATLGSLLRSAYAMGPGDRVRMLLDQEDSKRLSRVMTYYDYLNRFQMKRIEAIEQRARQLDGLRQQAEMEKSRLSQLAEKQELTHARLAMAQEERIAFLSSLERTIATRSERIEELHQRAQEMRVLLEQLERQARVLPEAGLRQEPLKQLRGHLSWPLAGAPLLSRYGSLKEDGVQRWDGVVLGAEEGTEVRAVHHGRVVYADWLRGFGLLLIIEHDEEYMTLYGHNQTLLKEPGEWVSAGETIALSGRTGGRMSPGLYFAIRFRGRPQNPEHWCGREVRSERQSPLTRSPAVERVGISLLQSREYRRTAGTGAVLHVVDTRINSPVTSL